MHLHLIDKLIDNVFRFFLSFQFESTVHTLAKRYNHMVSNSLLCVYMQNKLKFYFPICGQMD